MSKVFGFVKLSETESKFIKVLHCSERLLIWKVDCTYISTCTSTFLNLKLKWQER